MSSTTLEGIAAGLSKLGHALPCHATPVSTPELISAEIIISGQGFAVSKSIIASAHRLRGIVSPFTRIDGIDVAAATEHGIIVANGQVIENTESMAEATVLLLLAAMYDLHGTEAVLRQNLPRPRAMKARMLKGKTVGLIGWGQISRAVAQRLSGGGSGYSGKLAKQECRRCGRCPLRCSGAIAADERCRLRALDA